MSYWLWPADFSFVTRLWGRLVDVETYSAIPEDLLAILDELKPDKCVYVGHSVSAMVACHASIKRPELFERLTLLCASPRYLNDECYAGGFERVDIDGIFSAMKSNYSTWVSSFVSLLVGVDEPSVVKESRTKMMNMKPEIALVVAKTIFESDARNILCDVKIPCSIIQTRKDIAVPLAVPYYMQRNLGARETNSVHILDADGHLPQLTSPHMLANLFCQILARS